MPDFAQGFVRPGVYVKQTSGQGAPALPPPFTAAFIGHGSANMKLTVEIARGSTASDSLDATHETDSIVSVVDKLTGVVYPASGTSGYTLVSGSGVSSLTWEGTDQPDEGDVYVVTYFAKKNPGTDYQPKRFTSFQAQVDYSGIPVENGTDVLSGTTIENNITLGVAIAISQGMGEWWSLELDPWDETTLDTTPVALDLTDEADLKVAVEQALAKLLLKDAYALVPLFPMVAGSGNINNSILPVIKAHVSQARSILEQKWRVAFYGAQKNSDTGATPEDKYISSAEALASDANIYVAPSTCTYAYGGNLFTLPGYGIASAIAGIVANPVYDAGEPISGKQLVGFDEISDPFNNVQKNLLGNSGVLMIDNELSVPAIIMDLTTDQSNAVNSQVKFTKSKDYVSKTLRLVLRRVYINTRNLGPATLSSITGTVRMVLQQLVWLGILNDFSDLVVTKNSIDSRQIDVSVNILLVPDVSWIKVDLGVQL